MTKKSMNQTNRDRLEQLLFSGHPCIRITTHEEAYVIDLIEEVVQDLLSTLWYWTSVRGLFPGLEGDPKSMPESEHPAAALYSLAYDMNEPTVGVILDVAGHLSDARTARALRECIGRFRVLGGTLILVDHDDTLPMVIKAESTPFEVAFPDEDELRKIAKRVLRDLRARDEDRYKIAISKEDFVILVRNLRGLSRLQAEQVVFDALATDDRLDASDIDTVLAHKRQRLHVDGVLDFIQAPVDMDQIGGLARLKLWLDQRKNSLDEKAIDFGLTPPRGILLLGVQGAGKSLASKAVATSWQRPLLRLDPSNLYDRYVGESERKLRQALDQAELMAPIVLWIDEIEKGFASAASQSTDGGLSQRMFGTLLTWMQDHEAPVFIVATANNIEALPPELLRKGRFDEIFFVDLPDAEVRKMIFEIHLRKRKREPEQFDLEDLARKSDGFSGAEIEQAVIGAMHVAFSNGEELSSEHVLDILAQSPPLSVTMAEKIAALRHWARQRCVPAD
ncbi:MAG: AAA family ATPase [Planctomycetota bacterium]|nr:AAA family ATPase [Planctomycetota bacterium]